MTTYTLLPALLLALFAAPLQADDAEQAPDLLTDAQKRVFNGPFEHVVCLKGGRLNVRSENLRAVMFSAENYSPVKIFQGQGTKKQSGRMAYIKVQFPDLDEKTGWVAESLVRPRSRCTSAPQPSPETPRPPEEREVKEQPGETGDGILGLNDPNCCRWPLRGDVIADFSTKQRAFGAGRGGRLHAACDLYQQKGAPIHAVAPGRVLRNLYPFYQLTFAIEVRHSGGFVVRYGELTGKQAAGLRNNAVVQAGQLVGYMGKVSSGCCNPMLHFELYSGAKNGSLSGSGRFQRRSDLLNPTSYLRRWQENELKHRR